MGNLEDTLKCIEDQLDELEHKVEYVFSLTPIDITVITVLRSLHTALKMVNVKVESLYNQQRNNEWNDIT